MNESLYKDYVQPIIIKYKDDINNNNFQKIFDEIHAKNRVNCIINYE